LNSLFSIYGILVRETFTRKGDNGEGIIEQIDGVIEIDNQIYLVEMKWKKDKIGSEDIFAHLGRIYHRTSAQGIFISASGFADSGIIASKEALVNKAILVLTDLEEFIYVLEGIVEINYGKNTYILEEGDSIYYDSIVAHHVHAGAGSTAKILAVVYTPY